MARSRPPSLTTLAGRTIRDERLFARGDLVLCACSGGPDSTALLHALALLRKRVGHRLAALGVDHGLRVEAADELEHAARVAATLDVPFAAVRVEVAPGSNLQARARLLRHEALQAEAVRIGAVRVALGHTADDRAETFLLRLLRGAGPRGLAVLPPRARSPVGGVDLVRPIVGARRVDVRLHLERHGLTSAEDPSNADPRFLRARVRQELVPLLERLAPGSTSHLCHVAEMLRNLPADPLDALGRAQRESVLRGLRLGRASTTVRLRGGRDAQLTFSENTPVLPDEP